MTNQLLSSLLFLISFSCVAQIDVLGYESANIDCDNEKGLIRITKIGGGLPPYSYKWSNGATTSYIENLETGAYFVTVTDSHIPVNSVVYQHAIVNNFTQLNVDLGSDKVLSCANPEVTLTGMGKLIFT
jgi:hypothetical protein